MSKLIDLRQQAQRFSIIPIDREDLVAFLDLVDAIHLTTTCSATGDPGTCLVCGALARLGAS